MSWIGLRDAQDAVLCPGGLGQPAQPAPAPDTVIAAGSLWAEFRHEATDRPVNILRYTRRDPAPSVLTLRADPDGTLALMVRKGAQDALYTLHMPVLVPGDTVIVCYAWDTAAGRGVFSAQVPDRAGLRMMHLPAVLPPNWRDAAQIMTDRAACQTAPGLIYAALATHLAPIGPLPVIDGAGLMQTPSGRRRVDSLRIGDSVIAADGGSAQIRWIGSAELPARGGNAPYMMRSPYLGVGPDLYLSGSATLRLDGTEVEYLFGDAEVAVPLQHLADRRAILPLGQADAGLIAQPLTFLRRYYQMVIDRNVPLSISGAWVEALDVSRLIAEPALHRWSILRDIPAELLPRTPASLCTKLRDFEARTLRQMQAA